MPQQQPRKAPYNPVSVPVQGGSIRLYECTKCWSVITGDRLEHHTKWHERQQQWIKDQLIDIKWPTTTN